MKLSKNVAEAQRRYDKETQYTPADAVDLVKQLSYAKFDESVDMVFSLGIDARQADQIVRGTVSLPNGTGLEHSGADGVVGGIAPNELTAIEDCDDLAGTPWHKSTAARVEAL